MCKIVTHDNVQGLLSEYIKIFLRIEWIQISSGIFKVVSQNVQNCFLECTTVSKKVQNCFSDAHIFSECTIASQNVQLVSQNVQDVFFRL